MRKNKIELEIDFFKELDLPKPITCGLVNRIVSPKGLRKENSRGGLNEPRRNRAREGI